MKKYFLLLILILMAKTLIAQNYYLEDRWPNLKFFLPVGMFPAPDNSKRIFVLEQQGRIKMFKDSGNVAANDTSTVLDLTGAIPTGISVGTEYGLLGMAFHPQFTQNGFVFVNYTRKNPLTTIVSRFKVKDNNPDQLDPTSEKILLSIPQPYSNHNAGCLLFGDDGYLYIPTGDGGSGGDPGNRAQNKGVLLGKMLRIDVNVPVEDSLYLIPPDNPFANNTLGYKREIYATGLRNPWRVTKDPESSTIWIGDVGQSQFEEVDTGRIGANYGWKIMEGNSSYSACSGCDTSNYEKPIWTYPRSQGYSITGGYVYRGTELFRLKGTYFYGDYGTRRIWGLKKNSQGIFENEQHLTGSMGISSFGLDHEKELYMVGFSATAGKLLKIRCGPPTPVISSTSLGVCIGDTITLSGPPMGTNTAGWQWSTGDTTRSIRIFEPGTYQFTLKTRNPFGCWSYATAPVSVSVNIPPANPIVSDTGVCQGSTASVLLPQGLNYQWSTGFNGNPLQTTNAGNFWVIASDQIGCKSDTSFFQINHFPLPQTPVMILEGEFLKTDSVSGASYHWFVNNNLFQTTQVPRLLAFEGGAFHVVVVSADSCESAPSNIITLIGIKGRNQTDFKVFPNPAQNVLNLLIQNSLETIGDLKIQMADLQGKIHFTLPISVNQNTLKEMVDISNLPSGMYWLIIETREGRKTIPWVKQL